MKYYVIPISTTLLLFGCQLRTPTDQQASTPADASAAPARDVLQSHFGCTDTAEWTKCSAHTSEDACFADQCNGANGQCLPADGNCSQYTAESECTADSACTFFMPTDAACADRCALIDSEEACSRTPSCTWLGYFGCVSPGDAQCAVLDRPDTCGRSEISELPAGFAGPEAVGVTLYQSYALPLEVTSVILLVGIIGAVALAQRARKKTLSLLYDRPDQRADEETEA